MCVCGGGEREIITEPVMCLCIFYLFLLFSGVCVCVHVCVRVWLHACFWVMGFVHPLLLTARMYPWQRQVDPSCELVRGTWKGALNLSSHLPCALLSLTMAKCMALLKSQPRGCTLWLPPWTLASQHCHLLTWCKRCTRKTFSYWFFIFRWVQGSSVERIYYFFSES